MPETVDRLEIWFDRHGQGMPYRGVMPILEPFHDDPRFRDTARRMRLLILTEPLDPGGDDDV